LVLSDVWGSLDDELKRVFRSAAERNDRIDSRALLESLILLPEDHFVGQLLRRFDEEYDLRLRSCEELPGSPHTVPNEVSLSPAVREALQFFRIHKIRSVDARQYTRRLLQIGSDDTARRLENQGILRDMIERLE
jgi:hypothetical protein